MPHRAAMRKIAAITMSQGHASPLAKACNSGIITLTGGMEDGMGRIARWVRGWRPVAVLAMLLGAPVAPAAALDKGEPACRPEVASLGLPIRRANLAADHLRLTFVGHSTFLIETPQGVSAATDYNDYIRPRSTPVIATMNRAHSTHYSNAPDPGIKHLLRGWAEGAGRNDHDLVEGDLRVRNVHTNIRNFSGATIENGNSIFIYELGDFCVGHLGHLHHTLEPEHLRAIGRIDVLLMPVDGNYTMDLDGMLQVMNRVQARVVIPMHYFGQSTLNRFLDEVQAKGLAIDRRETPVAMFSRDSLPNRPTVVVLPGR
jgi:L-ascorbate metabolism protein UlaG (beta-lactamase superfamily)